MGRGVPDVKCGSQCGVGKNVHVDSVFFFRAICGFANALLQVVVSIVFASKFQTVLCTLATTEDPKQAAWQKQACRSFFFFAASEPRIEQRLTTVRLHATNLQ